MLKDKYLLDSRDYEELSLIKLHDNVYTYNHKPLYVRVNCAEGPYTFIDINGGPYISVGSKIEDVIVDEIFFDDGYMFKLKEDEKDI